MTDLNDVDQKLREIIYSRLYGLIIMRVRAKGRKDLKPAEKKLTKEITDDVVKEIKQAFEENEEWFNRGEIVLREDATQFIPIAGDPQTAFNQGLMWAVEHYVTSGRLDKKCMTGQAWYSRFLREYRGGMDADNVIKAAKRAAGIEK